jgi:hypothetical protein
MVKGLDIFRERFRAFEGAFTLIGGAVVFFALLGHILWQLRQSRAETPIA